VFFARENSKLDFGRVGEKGVRGGGGRKSIYDLGIALAEARRSAKYAKL